MAGWAPELVSTTWTRLKSRPYRGSDYNPSAVEPVASCYTDFAILLVTAIGPKAYVNFCAVFIMSFYFPQINCLAKDNYIPKIYFHTCFQGCNVNGTSVAPISQVCARAMWGVGSVSNNMTFISHYMKVCHVIPKFKWKPTQRTVIPCSLLCWRKESRLRTKNIFERTGNRSSEWWSRAKSPNSVHIKYFR